MSINQCSFSGRFVSDPFISRSQNGFTYTRFVLAINDRVYDKKNEIYRDKATFIPCIAYEEVARIIKDKCRKGTKVCITASVEQTMYKDHQNKTKKDLLFRVSDIDVEEKNNEWHSQNWF